MNSADKSLAVVGCTFVVCLFLAIGIAVVSKAWLDAERYRVCVTHHTPTECE